MSGAVRIGVIDSGVAGPAVATVSHGRRFCRGADGEIRRTDGVEDRLGHGSEITRLIREGAPDCKILHAQVFDRSFETSPALVAAGLDWLAGAGAQIVNMSFGLGADRTVLGAACRRAADQGVLLVAAAPARGTACYPAAYPEVVAVTGDARCGLGAVSDLQGLQADFGTWCASPERGGGPVAGGGRIAGGGPVAGGGRIAGASVAAAHFTGLAAAYLARHPGAGRDDVLAHFRAVASHVGPERRSRAAAHS